MATLATNLEAPTSFLSLPSEIRQPILEQSLVVVKPEAPYRANHEQHTKDIMAWASTLRTILPAAIEDVNIAEKSWLTQQLSLLFGALEEDERDREQEKQQTRDYEQARYTAVRNARLQLDPIMRAHCIALWTYFNASAAQVGPRSAFRNGTPANTHSLPLLLPPQAVQLTQTAQPPTHAVQITQNVSAAQISPTQTTTVAHSQTTPTPQPT